MPKFGESSLHSRTTMDIHPDGMQCGSRFESRELLCVVALGRRGGGGSQKLHGALWYVSWPQYLGITRVTHVMTLECMHMP